MMAEQTDPDFRSAINAAAAQWYSQRRTSLDRSPVREHANSHGSPYSSHSADDAPTSPSTGNGIPESGLTAWQGALRALPEGSEDVSLPIHPLAQALAEQPSLRLAEWNPYRQQGGFKPRTAVDYSSLMIYLSGQVNPNPCRNCRLKNGPYARCIVAPPTVLGLSSLKHACANCTYQSQHKKCTNLPINDEELVTKSRMARSSMKLKNPTPAKASGRRPKLASDRGHVIRKPTAQGISADSFGDKLSHIRSWSPRSRRRMKAEVKQWEAAIATVEAEDLRRSTEDPISGPILPVSQTPTTPGISFASPVQGSSAEAEVYEYGFDRMDEDEDQDRESDYQNTSWVGFTDMGPVTKPPL
ncbi:hypothetical protein ABKA04_004343 [Annulohypoxylon sp. FPYF3050]